MTTYDTLKIPQTTSIDSTRREKVKLHRIKIIMNFVREIMIFLNTMISFVYVAYPIMAVGFRLWKVGKKCRHVDNVNFNTRNNFYNSAELKVGVKLTLRSHMELC